ncbi:MAG: 16S rRNA (cytidine(1402)-2'-O)-methyltransferase [Chloroflexi bacterium]|nr:16S rRNA (cytidine(1402)-2'-O)-methyltransferase [Chloroflexota bacterium]
MSTLFLVATPIGNLEDISMRALRTLREVRLIAAEDTRHTRKLLSAYDIHTPLISYHEHNKISKLGAVLAALESGPVALVSDAGTPALNDPGYELVKAALSAGHIVTVIPGPAAPLAALVGSGLPTDSFLYLGYLPRKSNDRRHALENVANLPYTLIWLETPHRLLDALSDIAAVLGDRPVAVARELTKVHEEIFRGTLSSALEYYRQENPRGEFTLVVSGRLVQAEPWTEERLRSSIEEELAAGATPSELARRLAEASGWPRKEIYRRITAERE